MKERKRDNILEGFLGRTGGGDAPFSTVRAGRLRLGHGSP
jgi:hypothetical protein